MNPSEEWHLDTTRLGKRVLVFERLHSTNAFALGFADDPTNDGLAILADEQTAGRGQHGRTWSCPAGAGVLLSVLLFPPPHLRRPAILTAWAAVSVCEVIWQLTGLQAQIKWPNDVFVLGRKVCGILIEQAGGTVAGIGLNVNQPAEHFASAGLLQASSLAVFAGRQWSTRDIAKMLILELDTAFQRLLEGDVFTLQASWKDKLALIGKQVDLETATGTQSGQLVDMSFDSLDLRLADDTILCILPEAVLHLTSGSAASR
jgi:BirA family transcriptional regulator, biotin operon repressor / biotin---[acetyl-CoA-carboxylase] ligase